MSDGPYGTGEARRCSCRASRASRLYESISFFAEVELVRLLLARPPPLCASPLCLEAPLARSSVDEEVLATSFAGEDVGSSRHGCLLSTRVFRSSRSASKRAAIWVSHFICFHRGGAERCIRSASSLISSSRCAALRRSSADIL